jgi:hypothetical protein
VEVPSKKRRKPAGSEPAEPTDWHAIYKHLAKEFKLTPAEFGDLTDEQLDAILGGGDGAEAAKEVAKDLWYEVFDAIVTKLDIHPFQLMYIPASELIDHIHTQNPERDCPPELLPEIITDYLESKLGVF